MEFGLPEMQVIALLGLLAIASLAAWSSAVLWRRQRQLEEALAEVARRVEHVTGEPAVPTAESDDGDGEPAAQIAHLVELLRATDRATLEATFQAPFDLPRTAAIEIDGREERKPRFGAVPQRPRAGWEA
ncbi:MAG: transmembrane sensory transduction histidine kinase for metal resistance [Thermomicrobium sp.]|nr:transmembrane sensory transduction histidine kinase for metal resistance [Thermomicrobium sp.]